MKFYQFITLFSLFIHLFSNAQNFRASEWGMSIKEVKATETNDALKESEFTLVYQTTLAEHEALAIYNFEKNKLVKGSYLIIDPYSDKNDYVLAYNSIYELLKKDYGTLHENDKQWISDLYKENQSDWGEAVALGHLLYYSSWKKDDSDILLYMTTGKLQDIDIILEYCSKEYVSAHKEPSIKAALENFGPGGIRKCPWGVSPQQVKNTETDNLFIENVDKLGYLTKVNNLSMVVGYDFIDNALEHGKFVLNERHDNKNNYIDNYLLLNGYLERLFGTPVTEEVVWSDNLYRDDYAQWGKAIGVGHLYCYALYMNKMTKVEIYLHGKNDEIKLSVDIKKN